MIEPTPTNPAPQAPAATSATFVCHICAEPSTDICVWCTKDACANHCCTRCLRCSDCCECDLRTARRATQE